MKTFSSNAKWTRSLKSGEKIKIEQLFLLFAKSRRETKEWRRWISFSKFVIESGAGRCRFRARAISRVGFRGILLEWRLEACLAFHDGLWGQIKSELFRSDGQFSLHFDKPKNGCEIAFCFVIWKSKCLEILYTGFAKDNNVLNAWRRPGHHIHWKSSFLNSDSLKFFLLSHLLACIYRPSSRQKEN